jgi:hypothetical protein
MPVGLSVLQTVITGNAAASADSHSCYPR